MYELREYQKRSVSVAISFFNSPVKKNSIIVLPTGSGKSLVIADVVKELSEPCLILQPTKEILEQNISKFYNFGGKATIYSASFNTKEISKVTFATIGSVIHKKHLFTGFKHVLIDEAHLVNAKGGMYEELLNYLGVKTLGFSVGPNSYVELFGGPFGAGFVGSIEQAFIVSIGNRLPVRQSNGFEIVDFNNVMARGWDGKAFGWQPCKRIIRHIGKVPMRKIKAHSNQIFLTEDHSIYSVVRGESLRLICGKNARTKYRPKLICPASRMVKTKDIVMGDDGAAWECSSEKSYDMIDFIFKYLPDSRARVICDVATIPLFSLPTYGNRPKSMALRWIKNRSIPLNIYKNLSAKNDNLSSAELIRIEGSNSTIKPIVQMSKWAYILGFYLGDGWLCSESKPIGQFGFAVEHSIADKIILELQSMDGVGWNVRKFNKKIKSGSIEVRANNIFVYELIKHVCGHKRCYEKYIPGEWIISWSMKARLKLLEGLIDSDGYRQKENERNRKSCSFVTTSSLLADSLLSLLRSLGITGGKYLKNSKGKPGGIINRRQILGQRDSFSVIWSMNSGKNDNGHRGLRKRFIHDKYQFSELSVTENLPSSKTNYVYDLEMVKHPSFVASGFLVHNTATPYRLTTDGFGGAILKFLTRTRPRIFKDVIFCVQNKSLFDKGYLAPVEYVDIEGFDISKVRVNSTGADFDDDSLKRYFKIINHNDRIVKIVNDIKHKRNGVLVFNKFVEEAQAVKERIDCAEIVTAKTKKKDRIQIISNFRSGKTKVVCNVGVLVLGFDYPELDTIVLARPTMSLALYYQMIGRSIRPHPNKESALVVDLCGSYRKFGELENLKFHENNGLYFISNGRRQLTNVYYEHQTPIPERSTIRNNGEKFLVMPFGKYKNISIQEIPVGYLRWLNDNVSLYGELQEVVKSRLTIEGG